MKTGTGLVVLNYNDSETVTKFISKIRDYSSIDRIVIIDNCSTDGSFERLKLLTDEKIDVIKTKKNRGYASGNNEGVRFLADNYDPEFIVISNPDVFFTEQALAAMTELLQATPDAGLVTCRMNCLSSIRLPVAWKLPHYTDCLLQDSLIIKKLFGDRTEYRDSELTGPVSRAEVLPGSFFACRLDTFKSVGGFDSRTFLYYEENILAYRLKKAGKTNYLLNDYSYDHYHSVSIDKNIRSVQKRLEIAYESRKYYCKRYLKISEPKITLLGIFHYIGVLNYSVYNLLKGFLGNL